MNNLNIHDKLLTPESIISDTQKTTKKSGDTNFLAETFSTILEKQLQDTNNLQLHSNEMNEKLVLGEIDNVHDVMIAAQRAKLALSFTMEIRNALLSAYRKITQLR